MCGVVPEPPSVPHVQEDELPRFLAVVALVRYAAAVRRQLRRRLAPQIPGEYVARRTGRQLGPSGPRPVSAELAPRRGPAQLASHAERDQLPRSRLDEPGNNGVPRRTGPVMKEAAPGGGRPP